MLAKHVVRFSLVSCLIASVQVRADSRTLYWVDPSRDEILASPADGGGPVVTVLSSREYTSMRANTYSITADNAHIYFSDVSTQQIFSIRQADHGGLRELFSSSEIAPVRLSAQGDNVYWTDRDQSAIYRGHKSGIGTPERLFDTGSLPEGIATSPTHVYWAEFVQGSIFRGRLDGIGEPELLYDTPFSANGLDIDGHQLYWTIAGSGAIFTAPADGSITPSQLVQSQSARPETRGILAADGFAYFEDNEENTILRVPLTGGHPVVLFDRLDMPTSRLRFAPNDFILLKVVPEPTSVVLMIGWFTLLLTRRHRAPPIDC